MPTAVVHVAGTVTEAGQMCANCGATLHGRVTEGQELAVLAWTDGTYSYLPGVLTPRDAYHHHRFGTVIEEPCLARQGTPGAAGNGAHG